MIGQALALVCFTVVVPIEVIYAKESLNTTSAGFGILLSAWGAGIVLGSLLFVAVKNRSSFMLIVASTALIGIAYLGMSQASTLWLACVMSVVGGAGNGIQWVAVMTALQEATPDEYQARMSGLLESIGAAMPGVGYLLGGVLTQLGSPRTAFVFAGAGILVLVVGALILRPAHERRSHLDDDRQDHRAPLEPVVDEGREVVVQEALQHVGLGDLLLGRAVQRVLDRLAQLLDERGVAVQERHAAGQHLRRDDRGAVRSDTVATMMKMPSALSMRRSRRATSATSPMSTPSTKIIPACHLLPEARAVGVDFQGSSVLGAEDVRARHADRPARSEWMSMRLKSPWTGITYFGRVRLIIILTSSA